MFQPISKLFFAFILSLQMILSSSSGQSLDSSTESVPRTLVRIPLPHDIPHQWETVIHHRGESFTLVLEHESLRSEDFQVRDGTRILKTPQARTYRGYLREHPDSIVAATLHPKGLRAMIKRGDQLPLFIEPARDRDSSAPRHSHWIGETLSETGDPHRFGADQCATCRTHGTMPTLWPEPRIPSSDIGTQGGGNCTLEAEVAFDADFELYQLNGSSVAATVADIESVLNVVEVIFQRDVLISYELTEVIVRTTEPDPYDGSDAGAVLNQFRTTWNANHGGVSRDMAHLATARPLDAGILGLAWVSVACNLPWAYALSQFNVSFDTKVSVVGHELGHNWSAPHCLDPSCVLMCGGCQEFGSITARQIINYRDANADCLDTPTAFLPPIPPRAINDTAIDVSAPIVFDVLANDHDANCEPLSIESFEELTADGGRVERLVGTGPGGRDQLRYFPPLSFDGTDQFTYQIGDGSGLTDVGVVSLEATRFLSVHYKLDELSGFDMEDSTGNGNMGTFLQQPSLGEDGVSPETGTSVGFDGINDRSRIFNTSWFSSLNADFTVAAWVRPQSFGGVTRILANSGSWGFGLNGNDLRFSTFALRDYDLNVNLPLNTWSHVAASFDANFDVTFYVNGIDRGTITGSSAANGPTNAWFVGALDSQSEFFHGRIDDLQIYRGALSSSQVAFLYEEPGKVLCVGGWTQYGDGHPGRLGVAGLYPLNDPIPGTQLDLRMENVSGSVALANLLVGVVEADFDFLGGKLWLDPLVIVPFTLPQGGIDLSFEVPSDFPCVTILLQGIHSDAAASNGFALTPAIGITL